MMRSQSGFIAERFGRIAIAVCLAIGILALGAANTQAESVGFKDYTLFKFGDDHVDKWKQRVKFNGMVAYTCQADYCHFEMDAISIGGGKNIFYTCDRGAKLMLLQSGILLVPDDCVGEFVK